MSFAMDNERGPEGDRETNFRRDVRQTLDMHPLDRDDAIIREVQRLKRIEQACRALFDAPHQEHFASRLNDEEMAALTRIRRDVPPRART